MFRISLDISCSHKQLCRAPNDDKSLCSSRMKYLWTSHMCVFASFGLCSTEVWKLILKCLHLYTSQRVSTVVTAFHPLGFGLYLKQVKAQGWILLVLLSNQVSLLCVCIHLEKKTDFSGDFYTKQFHWSTLDGNIDVAMKNNHSFTKKVSILRNHQQSEKTLQSIILNDSVFHHVEYRFKGINPSSVMVCN